MNNTVERLLASIDEAYEQSPEVMAKLVAAAQPGAVFGDPIRSGEYTVIPVSEVAAGGDSGVPAAGEPPPLRRDLAGSPSGRAGPG